jgi:DNA invertase Pin-like site-specific DNA recombinase
MGVRTKNCGLIYLRRSGKRQETSLITQLEWAIAKAKELGIRIDATPADLEHMRENHLHARKSIRLDDGITGSDPNRPGLTALNRDAVSDRSISHILIFRRDRYSRPEDAVDAVQMEKELLRAGVSLVFSTKTVLPGERGQRDLARDIDALLEYNESGAFCEQLS